MSTVFPRIALMPKTNTLCGAQTEELNEVRGLLKTLQEKYTRYKITIHCLRDCISEDSKLPSDVKGKIAEILLHRECSQVIDLVATGESLVNSQKLLGLNNVSNKELSYNESLRLKKTLRIMLNQKYDTICEEFPKITGKKINSVLSVDNDLRDSCIDEEGLIVLRTKLNEQHQLFLNNLEREEAILEELIKLRQHNVGEACNTKLKECRLKYQINELKTKIIKEKARVNIFMEKRNSLTAYKELLKDMREQQIECQTDIAYLQSLRRKYQQVSCKQYDDILKSYLQYKSALAKKKKIYESL